MTQFLLAYIFRDLVNDKFLNFWQHLNFANFANGTYQLVFNQLKFAEFFERWSNILVSFDFLIFIRIKIFAVWIRFSYDFIFTASPFFNFTGIKLGKLSQILAILSFVVIISHKKISAHDN